jgi:hypothetical protein
MIVRLAKQLGVDPSFVYRVAHGQRNSEKIRQALEAEINSRPDLQHGL